MVKFARVLVFEVEEAKDKNAETPGGKFRKDTPWLVDAFRRKGVESEVLFITNKDTAESLKVGLYHVTLGSITLYTRRRPCRHATRKSLISAMLRSHSLHPCRVVQNN